MATITVYREYGSPLGRRVKVFIDGQLVGRVKGESRLAVQVLPGLHGVRVSLDWQESALVSVDVGEGDAVILRARVDLRATTWSSLLTRPGHAIDLDVVQLGRGSTTRSPPEGLPA